MAQLLRLPLPLKNLKIKSALWNYFLHQGSLCDESAAWHGVDQSIERVQWMSHNYTLLLFIFVEMSLRQVADDLLCKDLEDKIHAFKLHHTCKDVQDQLSFLKIIPLRVTDVDRCQRERAFIEESELANTTICISSKFVSRSIIGWLGHAWLWPGKCTLDCRLLFLRTLLALALRCFLLIHVLVNLSSQIDDSMVSEDVNFEIFNELLNLNFELKVDFWPWTFCKRLDLVCDLNQVQSSWQELEIKILRDLFS